ncbi:HAD family hydrolase [Kitasatospora cineracea]|uniref:HAD superfamily hydrolase (TIGR01509 family)/HAD superfamily hydrolase (TIGR01549 family) n=1 Tax=Kitasatospora cineracea TaxID=88074 RepID=A0A8G1UJU6_9ACTN|nr:HAD family hydrolase [Kitasatospora cineracea]ROR43022.1 HAD superfamily hydrolase (TIGR01509 family)/HAD superfamily hydrolase (TIGR01549 family) [Kitasatospora cineracea]
MGIRVLAVDFSGTLAQPGPNPDSALVADVLRTLPGVSLPPGFAAAFEAVHRRTRAADRENSTHTPFAQDIRRAAVRSGAHIPDAAAAADTVLSALPDGRVDPRAARAVHRLHAAGWRCVLACNTAVPEQMRRSTLRAAAIDTCFDALVLSSTLGLRKPHPGFYAAVVEASGVDAAEILFVGDNWAKDVLGPQAYGMRALLVAPTAPPASATAGVIRHFAHLPAVLGTPRTD